MLCPICGHVTADDAVFCDNCGRQIPRCPRCGKEISMGAQFCPEDGTPIPNEILALFYSSGAAPAAPKPKRKTVPILITVIGCLSAAVLVGVLALSGVIPGFDFLHRGSKEDSSLSAQEDKDTGTSPSTEIPAVSAVEPEAGSDSDSETDVQVEAIQALCTQTDANIQAYQKTILPDGSAAYSDGGGLKAVECSAGAGVSARTYYYDAGRLICVDCQGSEQLYFSGDRLIRWSEASGAVHDGETTAAYQDQETRTLAESASLTSAYNAPAVSSAAVSNVSASSTLAESNVTHYANRAVDGDRSTAWVEGSSGQGIGSSLTVSLDGTYRISGFSICAGYHKSSDLYTKNSRPSALRVSFSNGTSFTVSLNDVLEEQTFSFAGGSNLSVPFDAVTASSVTFTIESVYEGTVFEDTCISEISLF